MTKPVRSADEVDERLFVQVACCIEADVLLCIVGAAAYANGRIGDGQGDIIAARHGGVGRRVQCVGGTELSDGIGRGGGG